MNAPHEKPKRKGKVSRFVTKGGHRCAANVSRLAKKRRRRATRSIFKYRTGAEDRHAAAFWLGAASMVLISSFLGFLTSRLPRCSPLAMSISRDLMLLVIGGLGLTSQSQASVQDRCAHQKK